MSSKTANTEQPVALVLSTHSSDENFNGDCDYALVRLTPELVAQVHRRVELARQGRQQDDELYELYFWDGAAEFHDCGLVDACQEAVAAARGADGNQAAQDWLTRLEQDGHALVPPAANLAACQPQRTECAQMIVRASPSSDDPEYEIAWTAIPKHSDVHVTTSDLPLAALEDYVGGEKAE
jgi:hypothetical protein